VQSQVNGVNQKKWITGPSGAQLGREWIADGG